MLEKLKQRWELTTNWDVIAVLIVFSLAGSTSVYIKKPILNALEISWDNTPVLKFMAIYLLILMPVYQLLFLTWGFIWRQWNFVWKFEKKMFKRFLYIEAVAVIGLVASLIIY